MYHCVGVNWNWGYLGCFYDSLFLCLVWRALSVAFVPLIMSILYVQTFEQQIQSLTR